MFRRDYFRRLSTLHSFFILILLSGFALADSPKLNFSDLISGPRTGLNDGSGSGAIVTIWGQNLKNEGEVHFIDSEGAIHSPHVYYWKRADGKLPSGPANLHESHLMYEIALSIPASASFGKGAFAVSIAGEESNHLPFTVRPGEIYHVKSNGVDHRENGTWARPWRTMAYAINEVSEGGTLYVHDVDEGEFEDPRGRGVYWNSPSSASGLEAQLAIAAYPGFQPKVIAQKAFENFRTSGQVVSKFDIYASNYLQVDSQGQPLGDVITSSPKDTYGVQTSQNGRVVANRIGDIPGGCASAWNGAINGAQHRSDNVKIFGNEIYEYGCNGSSKLHHTTYLSVRSSDDIRVNAWEWGYNYLRGNRAKFGIHQYDERTRTTDGRSDVCGDVVGAIKIHNNVIIDQGGAGISVGSTCNWSMDVVIENNILNNVGLAAAWDGISPNTSDGAENGAINLRDQREGLTGQFYIFNNLIYKYTTDEQTDGGLGCISLTGGGENVSVLWFRNICYTERDLPFFGLGFRSNYIEGNILGRDNIWAYAGLAAANEATVPVWDGMPFTQDPNILKINSYFIPNKKASIEIYDLEGYPAEALNLNPTSINFDIYGRNRESSRNIIGPILGWESYPPSPPHSLIIE